MAFMKFEIKDPGSAITHFIGMLMAAFAATPLLIRASQNPDKIHVISLAVFIASMILLYAASTKMCIRDRYFYHNQKIRYFGRIIGTSWH